MNYFARENANLGRINYKNTYKIDKEIEKLKEQSKSNYFYNQDHEYAVIWYGRQFKTKRNANDETIYIEVELINLTEPTYTFIDRETQEEKEHDSYIKIEVAINYLHKLPIGSIWKNGRSKQYFDLPRYQGIEVTKDNYEIYSIGKAVNYKERRQANKLALDEAEVSLPFEYENYYERIYKYDKNQLIIINHDDQRFVIHPILLFITHYGYSMDIKRIITKYSRNIVREKLIPENNQLDRLAREQGYNEYVIIPKGMTQRDAVFLYHYKYDNEAKNKVDRLNDNIQQAKIDSKNNIIIDFWNLPTTLNLKGIRIGDTIFCTAITGISEPIGEPINILLQPKRRVNLDSESEVDFTRVIPFTPPQNIEELDLDFVRDPVNNIAVQVLKERLERIGDFRELNRVEFEAEEQNAQGNIQYIPHHAVEQFGIGDLRGQAGVTGLARCFYETNDTESKNRFDKVWQHAKAYAKELNTPAQWFTYDKAFQTDDKYFVMSLDNFHNAAYDMQLPKHVLVIVLVIQNISYYVLEFGEVMQAGKLTGFRGIAYRADRNEDFLYSRVGLPDLLLSVVEQNGTLSEYFVDKYRGKLAFFMHKDIKRSNWVKNGVEKIRLN